MLVPRDGLEPPFSGNRPLVLPLDERGVNWLGRLDSNQRSRAPEARALGQTEPLPIEIGQRGETISATTRAGVRDWTCTSYSAVTARGLSASPSPTKWYPWQELHLHASRRCGLNAVRLLFCHRGVVYRTGVLLHPLCIRDRKVVDPRGNAPRRYCLQDRPRAFATGP